MFLLSFAVLRRSLEVMVKNFGSLVLAAIWPILLFSLPVILLFAILKYNPFGWLDGGGTIALLFLSLPFLYAGVLICFSWTAIAWHRLILLGAGPETPSIFFDKTLWRYAGILFLMLLAVFLFVTVMSVFSLNVLNYRDVDEDLVILVTSGIIYVVSCYVCARVSLIFPAIALGQRLSIKQAWAASAPYQGAMFLVALGLLFIAGFLTIGLMTLGGFGGTMPGLLLFLIGMWLGQFLFAAAITIFYGHIVEKRVLN